MKGHTMRLIITALLALTFSSPALAGCIGPTIMGECKGKSVKWDTGNHTGRQREPDAGPVTYYDRSRDEVYKRNNPGAVNPYNGKSAHDSTWTRRGSALPGRQTPLR